MECRAALCDGANRRNRRITAGRSSAQRYSHVLPRTHARTHARTHTHTHKRAHAHAHGGGSLASCIGLGGSTPAHRWSALRQFPLRVSGPGRVPTKSERTRPVRPGAAEVCAPELRGDARSHRGRVGRQSLHGTHCRTLVYHCTWYLLSYCCIPLYMVLTVVLLYTSGGTERAGQ